MEVKKCEGKGEKVWNRGGEEKRREEGERKTLEMGVRRENSAIEESRVIISASCVCSGGFYVGVFINKIGDENVTKMKEVRFYSILGF